MAFRNTKGQLTYGLVAALVFMAWLRYCSSR